MLYDIRVRFLSKKRAEITLMPTWLGRLFKRRVRVGVAYRARNAENSWSWWWERTDRHVGSRIEGYIEAAPLLSVDDMTVEQLLLEEKSRD